MCTCFSLFIKAQVYWATLAHTLGLLFSSFFFGFFLILIFKIAFYFFIFFNSIIHIFFIKAL